MLEVPFLPRNKYPEETERKILDAALKLFLEKGYESTTILDIVDNMGGLTRGAFYHHYKSKEEVLDALGDRFFYENNPFEAARESKDLNGLDKLKLVLKLLLENKEYQAIGLMSISFLSNPRFLVMLLKGNEKVLSPLMNELIIEGMSDGSIPKHNSKIIADLMILFCNFWLIPSIFPANRNEMEEKIAMIKKIFDSLGILVFDDEIINEINIQLNVVYPI